MVGILWCICCNLVSHKIQCKHRTEIFHFLLAALVCFYPQQSADILIDLCITTAIQYNPLTLK